MKKRKIRYDRIALFIVTVILLLFLVIKLIPNKKETKNLMVDLSSKTIEEIKGYAISNDLKLEFKYENNDSIAKDKMINQSIKVGSELKKDDTLIVKYSLGKVDYAKFKVDESGNVPIMMYHGIHKLSEETAYTGGNVDKDGYQRTAEAFIKDLELYYKSGYRMIKLKDYVEGIIDVEVGKSPIILTFDDGLKNNINVTGLDDKGNIIIDPNSAVGILETFKKKYPDFNVTATFFLNGGLFEQKEYNEKIMKWLIDNGYDIGNHSYGHDDFTKTTPESTQKSIGRMYQVINEIIPNKYVSIVALPFGSPYNKSHDNFEHILKGKYNDFNYETTSTLRVGWESEFSPFHKDFNKVFLKRIRAYDNAGKEFDIEHNFEILEKNRYISDGNKDTIVVPKEKSDKINSKIKVVTY